ncbi:MAG: PTS sugar transporter subunit IIC [Erysipelotrichaceae bacterium]
MKKILDWIENNLTPAMNKINHNIWIVTLKDSINQVMPLIFLGSIFSLLTLPGSMFKWSWWPKFSVPQGWTMGMISLMMAFLIPYNFMEKNRLRKSRIIAGIAGLILYAITITPQLVADNATGFSHQAFGAGGMFIAIFTGLITGFILKMFGKFSFFKEDSNLPDFIRQWFDQMLPIATVVILGWVVVGILNFDLYNVILAIFKPLQGIAETYWGFIALIVIKGALYSMGISAWVLVPITMPIMLAGIEANIAGTASNVFTPSFQYAYYTIGGGGCTLGLAFLLLRSKSKKLKSLGKAVVVPSIFNINEPLVFGAIAYNIILMIPMVLNCFVSASLAYLFTRVIPFGVIPDILFQLWYCPYPICTWLATGGSITSVILVIGIFVVTTLVWYPFFKIYENQCLKEEQLEGEN